MTKSFRPWRVDETWLLPPSVQDFVPAGHPAHLVRDIVREELDLSAILSAYTEARGFPPYHPGMMVALLLYAYSQGVYSSRRIARGCEERLDFQAVTALNRPDFRTISEFGGPVAAEPKMHFRSIMLHRGLDPEDVVVPEAGTDPNGTEKVSHANVPMG